MPPTTLMINVSWIACLLLACDDAPVGAGADPDAAADAAEEALVPTPWVFDANDDATPAPTLTSEELVALIIDTAQTLRRIDARPIAELHDRIVDREYLEQGGPNGCPYVLTFGYGSFYWQGECVADDGTRYLGSGIVYADSGGAFYRYLSGLVEAPDGTWIEGAGELSDGYTEDGLKVIETFSAGGPRAPDDPWLDGTRALRMTHKRLYRPANGGVMNAFDAMLRAPDLLPEGVDAVVFDQLTFTNEGAGAYCEIEPGGAAAVRTSDGGWYEITFDGRTREEEEKELAYCDGCGRTTFRGETLGPTCVDPAPLFSP